MASPIGDYALLSDCQGAALVDRRGSIDWACLGRFDAPSTFARLLDPAAGHWSLTAGSTSHTTRAYVENTMVLRTEHTTDRGRIAVTDALVFEPDERGHEIGRAAPHTLARLVEGLAGEVEVDMAVAPRPEYGLTVPLWRTVPGGAVTRGGPTAYLLSAPVDLEVDGGTLRSRVRVRAGERLGFALHATDPWQPGPDPWSTEDVALWVEGTVAGWRSWSELHQSYTGPYAELVHHSGRVLQALTYAPTGAVIAAPTTSLPESIGGSRNWDYRYAWIRDASLTVSAMWVAACPDEIGAFFDFFLTAAGHADHDQRLQIVYGIAGERRLDELELDHLAGYRDSRPVRIGNAAWRQEQLDVYGEILDAAALYADNVGQFDDRCSHFLIDVADQAAKRWREPDHGIWEMRGEPRHFVHSKLMCWVALDRALLLAEALDATAERDRWRDERDEIRDSILSEGWSDAAGAFTQSYGGDVLDASALLIPIVGFLPGNDPRVLSTIDAIQAHLTDKRGLVYRYRSDDGIQGGEGTFGICTYWLAQALASAGRISEARHHFDAITAFANDVGLLAEEIDSTTAELLGNFPQAFTHVGLVNAAWAIANAAREATPPSTGSPDTDERGATT